MMTKAEQSQIKQLLQQPMWQTAERVAEELIQHIEDDTCVRNTEWETARAAIERESKIEGIRQFIKSLYTISQQ